MASVATLAPISLTDRAVVEVKNIIQEKNVPDDYGLRIGVQGGTVQDAYANSDLAAGNTVVAFGTADQAIADLAAGNLDIILADGAYLEPIVAAGAVEFVGEPIAIGGGFAPALRKDEADLKGKINTAIEALKADGTVDTLIAKWFEGAGPYYKM